MKPEKKKDSPNRDSDDASWRKYAGERSEARTKGAKDRDMSSFLRVYGIVLACACLLVVVLFSGRILGCFADKVDASTPDTPIAGIEFSSDGVIDRNWFLANMPLPAGATMRRFDHARLKSSLLSMGQVTDAEVTKVLPDRLVVRIRERTPIARISVQGDNGRPVAMLIDEKGLVYRGVAYSQARLSQLPWVVVSKVDRAGSGFAPIREANLLCEILSAARAEDPALAADWRIIDFTRFGGDTQDPGSYIRVSGARVNSVLFSPNVVRPSMTRLAEVLRSNETASLALPTQELDLRMLPSPRRPNEVIVRSPRQPGQE